MLMNFIEDETQELIAIRKNPDMTEEEQISEIENEGYLFQGIDYEDE